MNSGLTLPWPRGLHVFVKTDPDNPIQQKTTQSSNKTLP